MMKINEGQKKIMIDYFKNFMSREAFKIDLEKREEHRKDVVKFLGKDKLEGITEIDFGKLISSLWASRTWGNKDYLVGKLIQDNGIEKIKEELWNLLYGKDPTEERFDRFKKEIKGLGPSSMTEILCLFDPENYGIWNIQARKGLEKLKFDADFVQKYHITGREYMQINELFREIAGLLKQCDYEKAELLAVDYFLYEVGNEKEAVPPGPSPADRFNHDEVRDFIKQIGDWLGFETETEKTIASGARVDVVWVAKIANLGVVTYVFEVQKSGSIDSLIVNLQKALKNPTVQKIVAVSSSDVIERIKNEAKDITMENFKRALTYWDYEDVLRTHENLLEAFESIDKLELVKSQFGAEEKV